MTAAMIVLLVVLGIVFLALGSIFFLFVLDIMADIFGGYIDES